MLFKQRKVALHSPFPLFVLLFTLLFSAFNTTAQTFNWTNPDAWDSGTVPSTGDDVFIPNGKTIILNTSPLDLGSITIEGTLTFADMDIDLRLGYILVSGSGVLEIGTETAPVSKPVSITLTGTDYDATGIGLGNKFIMAMGGGRIDMHGKSRSAVSWTQLRKHASPGDTHISLADSVNWVAGDEIVIAPSGTDPYQYEKRTITSVSGTVVNFSPALSYKHYGRIENIYGNKIDMRAEVGLLSRNILLQGDAASETSKFGGHMMIMMGSSAHIEGVEFYRMGQYGQAGRYPMHWHFSGPSSGEYAKNNSIHNSFHRAIVTHQSDNILVQDNVAFNVWSHMYVPSEDGNEVGNTYIHNLGIFSKTIPDFDEYAFPDPSVPDQSTQSERHPAIFWLSSPAQILIGNHAVGALNGQGFFYDGVGTATLATIPTDFFKGNVAHSCYSDEGGWDRAYYRTKGWGLFVGKQGLADDMLVFSDFLAYKNTLGGAWLENENTVLSDALLVGNGTGANLHRSGLVNSVVIGSTHNTIAPTSKDYGGINIFSQMESRKEAFVENVSLYNLSTGILIQDQDVDLYTYARNLDLKNVVVPVFMEDPDMKGGFMDRSGDLTLVPNSLLLAKNAPELSADCGYSATFNAWVCPLGDYAHLTISNEDTDHELGTIEVTNMATSNSWKLFTSETYGDWEIEYDHKKNDYLFAGTNYNIDFFNNIAMDAFDLTLHCSQGKGLLLHVQFPPGYKPRLFREDGSMMSSLAAFTDLSLGTDGYFYDATNGLLTVSINLDFGDADGAKTIKITKVPLRLAGPDVHVSDILTFPNPFADQFNIQFNVPVTTDVIVSLYNIQGTLIKEMDAGSFEPGQYTVPFKTNGEISAGAYIYEVRTETDVHRGMINKIKL